MSRRRRRGKYLDKVGNGIVAVALLFLAYAMLFVVLPMAIGAALHAASGLVR